jgi:hypothetical protein
MADIVFVAGYVRRLWAWDFEPPWGGHSKGFFVLIQPHRTPEQDALWLVDNPRLEALLAVAYTTGQLVSVTSHKESQSISPLDLNAKTKPKLSGFPVIDVVAIPPHPGEP